MKKALFLIVATFDLQKLPELVPAMETGLSFTQFVTAELISPAPDVLVWVAKGHYWTPIPAPWGHYPVGGPLRLNYQNGGGEKFVFTSGVTQGTIVNGTASYEDGADTATYTYTQQTGPLDFTRSGGETYRLIIPPGSNTGTTTVTYIEPGSQPAVDPAAYTLIGGGAPTYNYSGAAVDVPVFHTSSRYRALVSEMENDTDSEPRSCE